MNTPQINEVQNFDFTSYRDKLKAQYIAGIFDMVWLHSKQDTLPNKWIMQPIIILMWHLWNKLEEIYQKEVDPITWLAWCYYEQWYSCNTISSMLAEIGIKYKKWSLSQFTMKQCNWIKRSHTHITQEGIEILRIKAQMRRRANNLLEK